LSWSSASHPGYPTAHDPGTVIHHQWGENGKTSPSEVEGKPFFCPATEALKLFF
jgi:hypothetical protein